MLNLFIFHSILQPPLLSRHVCSASPARNNSRGVDSALFRSTITSLWFYNDSCIRDSFFFKSLVRLKERTIRVSMSARYFPRFLLPLCKFALSSRPLWKASHPFAPAREDFVCTLISRSVERQDSKGTSFSLHEARKIEENRGGIFFGTRTVINLSCNILSKI